MSPNDRGDSVILATGRHGSIGRSLPESVFPLKSRLEDSVEVMQAELARFPKASALIHLAALTNVGDCEKNPELAFELNVQGAVRWLKAARAAGVAKFVYVSSAHVFRPRQELVKMSVDEAGDALSVYGRTKLEAEKALQREAISLGIEFSIARVFSVIAPHGKQLRRGYLHAELQRRATERDFSPVPGYKNVRDFIDTDRIANRLMALASGGTASGLVHICTGEGKTVRALAEEVFAEAGISAQETAPMFPANNDVADYLVGQPN